MAPRSDMIRQPNPQMIAPISGAKRMIVGMGCLPFHHVDVFDRDGAAVTEETDKDRQTNRGLGGGDGQNKKRENLADKITQMVRASLRSASPRCKMRSAAPVATTAAKVT